MNHFVLFTGHSNWLKGSNNVAKYWQIICCSPDSGTIGHRVSHRFWEHGGGVLFKIWWGGGLSQYMGKAWGLKILPKNTCEGVHFIVKLPAISLQACKFTKSELHTYFWRILARFLVIIYCAFSRNHLMEGCFDRNRVGGHASLHYGKPC